MRYLVLFIAFLLPLSSAVGQTTLKPEDIPKDFSDQKPFDLEAGTDAVVLTGKGVLFNLRTEIGLSPLATPATESPSETADATTPTVPWTPFVSYDLNAQYDYTERTERIADLSLRPSIMKGWFSPGDPFDPDTFVMRRSLVPFLDLRSRSVGGATSSMMSEDDIDESFFYIGAGVQYRQEFRTLLEWQSLTGADLEQPTVGITYYERISGELPEDAPEGIDALQVQLTFDVPIPLTASLTGASKFRREYEDFLAASKRAAETGSPLPNPPQRPSFPFTFSVTLKASRPIDGDERDEEFYADLALKMMHEDSKVGYALRYRTGEELGFEYDEKLLASIVVRLFE